MMQSLVEQLEELGLVAEILDTLSKTNQGLRRDQVNPLTERIRRAVKIIGESCTHDLRKTSREAAEKERVRWSDGLPELAQQARLTPAQRSVTPIRKQVVTKPSSISAVPVPRRKCPQGHLAVSKEVSSCLASTLYNVLEATTRLLKASFAHVFLRKGDEMVSIANCSARLSFPPQLIRHRCLGSLDADVLASGIALNQFVTDGSKPVSSLLIFPIFPSTFPSSDALAVIHVENKYQGSCAFNNTDEGIILTATQIIGSLMSCFPQMDWIKHFYDPVTQHILSPFEPPKKITVPHVKDVTFKQSVGSGMPTEDVLLSDAITWKKIEECNAPLLIKREILPRLTSEKPMAQGLSTSPSLREVAVYVENMHSCWRRSMSNNLTLSEEEHSNRLELKALRRELTKLKALYEEAKDELRIYRLEGQDYEKEFCNIKNELDAYVRKRDKMDVL